MPTAFVAGATGYTGRAVVRALVRRRVDTVAHVRPDAPTLADVTGELQRDGAVVDTTPWEEAAFTETIARLRPDVVFALLGTTRKRERQAARAGAPPASYEAVDYGLTALLLRAATKAGSVSRFVYLSSLGVEESPGAYYAARRKVEAELRSSGLAYVIARPSFITGPDRAEDRPGERIAATVTDAALSLLGGLGARRLRDRYASMNAAELGEALVALALSAREPSVVADAIALRRAAAGST
ncbi:MAG TPA: NAD(P)H-binding protein [Polyangiaceae bacterium]|nr:NAD(P)H-binding protein [Polyangiaceae bacterium]